MVRRLSRVGILLALATIVGVCACARTNSFSHFRDLEREIASAKELKADTLAASAYDYFYALECLYKAKSEHSYADYEWSDTIALDGLAAAKRAVVAAREKSKALEEPAPEALAEQKRLLKQRQKKGAKRSVANDD